MLRLNLQMGNQTACQLVANMCTMMMYKDDQKSSPCSMFTDRKRIPTSNDDVIPWLYYGEGEAPAVLSRKRISTKFGLNSDSRVSRGHEKEKLISKANKKRANIFLDELPQSHGHCISTGR